MDKMKILIIFIGIVFILFLLLIVIPHIYHLLKPIKSNDNFDTETNTAIKKLVNQTLRVYYGTYSSDKAAGLFSEELRQKIEKDVVFSRFHKRNLFRLIDRNYMQSLVHLSDNDAGEAFFFVIVRVYEGLVFGGTTIHQMSIKRETDGYYIIVNIEYDV
jgi:hypothetical protein